MNTSRNRPRHTPPVLLLPSDATDQQNPSPNVVDHGGAEPESADETSKQDRQPLPNALAEQLTYPKCRFKALDDAERESRRRTSELRHTAAQAAHWIVPTTIAKHRRTSDGQVHVPSASSTAST